MGEKETTDKKRDSMTVLSTPAATVPKYVTNVAVTPLNNGSIVIAFIFGLVDKSPSSLVETILVDGEHAGKIAEVLQGAAKSAEKMRNDTNAATPDGIVNAAHFK